MYRAIYSLECPCSRRFLVLKRMDSGSWLQEDTKTMSTSCSSAVVDEPTSIEDSDKCCKATQTEPSSTGDTQCIQSSTSSDAYVSESIIHLLNEVYPTNVSSHDEVPTRKRLPVDDFISFLSTNNICSVQQWNDIPYAEKQRFLRLPHFNSLLNSITSNIAHSIRLKAISIDTDAVSAGKRVLYEAGGHCRISQFLTDHHRWATTRVRFFAKILLALVNRKTGKKNCIWIYGPSNAGKSQLMESFVRKVAYGVYGVPLANARSNFMFGNCASKRLISGKNLSSTTTT